MVEKILDEFRSTSLEQLKSLKSSDIFLLDETPITENITIILKPDIESLREIEFLITDLKLIDPNQFYYPLERLHLTIVGNIPKSINIQSHISSIKKIIKQTTIKFKLFGLGSNQFTSSISAYPINFSIHTLRDEIRKEINSPADDYSRILEYYEFVGWLNYLRYLVKPKQDFLQKLYSYKDVNFGILQPKKIQIFKTTSKIIDPNYSVLIDEFSV